MCNRGWLAWERRERSAGCTESRAEGVVGEGVGEGDELQVAIILRGFVGLFGLQSDHGGCEG